jgi:TetR/AcrR family transcriptional regulator, cholesterol catabolism regulator
METLVTHKVSIVLQSIMADIETGIRIKEKAHVLFMQYGLRSVSMDDIAGNLGMSKKTIYQYYADKDELIEAVISEELLRSQHICEKDQQCSDNAIHEIFLALKMVVDMMSTMNPSLIYDMQKYHPKAYQKFHQHKNDYLYSVIRVNMERGIREGLYREDINLDILSRYRVESILLPFNPDFHTRVKYTLAKLQEELIIHFLFGLASPKGYKLIIKYQQERLKLSNDEKKQN